MFLRINWLVLTMHLCFFLEQMRLEPLVIIMTKVYSHHSLPWPVSTSMPCMGVYVRCHLLLPGIGITLVTRDFLATPACGLSSSIAQLSSSWRAWVHGYSRDTSPCCSGWLFTPCSYTCGSSVGGSCSGWWRHVHGTTHILSIIS